jgi:alpha-tubulin suppressor-like RCC1 family protein
MAVACGDTHTAFVCEDGGAWTLGSGIRGQLGHGDAQPRWWPARVRALGGLVVEVLSSGSSHMAAITAGGCLWTWGEGAVHGQLGHGDFARRMEPTRVEEGEIRGARVSLAACGAFHTLALAGGEVWSCGGGESGQLGRGRTGAEPTFQRLGSARFGEATMLAVAAGAVHSAALEAAGIWTWGSGEWGELGHGDRTSRLVPARLGLEKFGGEQVVLLAARGDHANGTLQGHSAAVTAAGALFLWGANKLGQCGQGDREDRLVPSRVSVGAASAQAKVVMAACGDRCTLAVTEEGALFACGAGEGGQLGCDDTKDRLALTQVSPRHFGGAKVAVAASSHAHSAAITRDGCLWTWGTGRSVFYRQAPAGLGTGSLDTQLVPAVLPADKFGGVRVGRFCAAAIAPECALAFAMGTHPRLGPPALAELLPELVHLVVAAGEASWAGEAEAAVARLVGGGKMKQTATLAGW